MENTEQQKKDEQFMRRALVEAEAARDEVNLECRSSIH